MSTEFEKIAVIDNEIEAQALGAILEQIGVPHRIDSFYDTAFDGLFQSQKGWGAISAPSEHKAQIEEIIAELRSGGEPDESPDESD
jgi:hypothetical protein